MKNISINIKGIKQDSISIPLSELSHTIIFGATGSGKSNLLHMLITNIAETYSPDDIQIALIDPKYVEFNMYKSLPHLIGGIMKSPSDIRSLFCDWIDEKLKRKTNTPVVIIIDELAELSYNKEIISKINNILDKGAKRNIYLIMASQRPSIIPEEIINKTTTKICFPIDSDNLPKELARAIKANPIKSHGEMLFSNNNKIIYIQTNYITRTEINDVVLKYKK